MTDRELVETFIRACYKREPPKFNELGGRSFEEDVAIAIDEIMANPADLRAISIIMNDEQTDELPGKVHAWRKVLHGPYRLLKFLNPESSK